MLVTNHTRKAIKINDIELPVGKPIQVADEVYHAAIASSDALKTLMLNRKISAQREDKPKAKKSPKEA